MTSYANYNPTSLIVGREPKARTIMLAQAAGSCKRGTVLGRVTASDKYIPCLAGASDGSQVPVMILAADADATAADVSVPAYDEAEVAGELLTIDASWTIATLEASLRQNNRRLYVRSIGTLG